MLYGAILGDIIGSRFEFDRGDKTKDFVLFTNKCNFTDDTVMTIAVAKALIESIDLADLLKDFGRRYPNAGYGSNFNAWLKSKDRKPYNSYGNGSAMRVSSVGWLYNNIEDVRKMARYTAEVTHNHPEGIKGAEATATAIFLARMNYSKDVIKSHIENRYGYDLNFTLDEIRPSYHHVESCQETVPQAIVAFLEGTDFEDVIRNAISLGGDTDTLAAIAGSIAEAFYTIPEYTKCAALGYLDPYLRKTVLNLERKVKNGLF